MDDKDVDKVKNKLVLQSVENIILRIQDNFFKTFDSKIHRDYAIEKFENIIDACNLAIQKYEELYYHYYWLHHIPKIAEEFVGKENYNFEFLSKIKELDQFNILKFSLVDDNALVTCEKLKIHKSFDILNTVQNPKEHFTKIRDITIKYLKSETDIIFKTITFEYLMM